MRYKIERSEVFSQFKNNRIGNDKNTESRKQRTLLELQQDLCLITVVGDFDLYGTLAVSCTNVIM